MSRVSILALIALLSLVLPSPAEEPATPPPESPTPVSEAPAEPAPAPAEPTPAPPRPSSLLDTADPSGFDALGGLGGGKGMGMPGGGSLTPGVTYQATWLPAQSVKGQPADLGFVRQDFSVGSPLWSDGPMALLGRVHVRSELFDTDAILPDSRRSFPSDLWNVGMGLTGIYRFECGWVAGGGINFGSASDRPFADLDTLNVGFNVFLRVPSCEHNAWMFTLAYSPLSQLPFPVPGVAYVVNTERYSAYLGLPLRFVYRPRPDWTFDASYMLLTNVRAHVTYHPCDNIWLHGGFDWTNESYYLSDRSPLPFFQAGDNYQRFFYYEKRLSGGARFKVWRGVNFDLTAGYAFDRYYQRGKSVGGGDGIDRLDVGAGPFVSGQVQFRW
jgi:hypothetical protein